MKIPKKPYAGLKWKEVFLLLYKNSIEKGGFE